MHYSKTAFGINGLDTIITTNPSNSPIGQRNGMSPIDIAELNAVYGLVYFYSILLNPKI